MHSTLILASSSLPLPIVLRCGKSSLRRRIANSSCPAPVHCGRNVLIHILRDYAYKHGALFLLSISLLTFISACNIMAQAPPEAEDRQSLGMIITVKDASGIPVADALVADDRGRMQYHTNSNGSAEISCTEAGCRGVAFEISASGYKSVRISFASGYSPTVAVFLERSGQLYRPAKNITNVVELSRQNQYRLESLRREIARNMAATNYESAEFLLKEAFQLNQSEAWISNCFGIIALRRNDLGTAEAWFYKAAESAPSDPDILGNCGLLRWMQNRTDESHALLSKAFSLGYKSNFGYYVLGILDLMKGHLNEARDSFKRISSEQYPHRDLYMSLAWRGLGKYRAADRSYLSYLRNHPVLLIACELEYRSGFGSR